MKYVIMFFTFAVADILLETTVPELSSVVRDLMALLISAIVGCFAVLLNQDRQTLREGKMAEKVTRFPINVTSKAELRAHLLSRIHHPRFITPVLLLCQLQNGSIHRVAATDKILTFTIDEIDIALSNLEARGLK